MRCLAFSDAISRGDKRLLADVHFFSDLIDELAANVVFAFGKLLDSPDTNQLQVCLTHAFVERIPCPALDVKELA